MPDQVSIVIPTFNRAKMLPKAIESALSQTAECEIVVVDHGSSDSTAEVARSYGGRIKYVRQDTDFGPHFCWLDGVLQSSGDLVHLQFDDDAIEPGFIEQCLLVMDDETGFAFTAAQICGDGNPEPIKTVFGKWLPSTGIYPVSKIEKRFLGNIVSPGCCLFRRQTLIDALYQGQLPLSKNHYHGVGPDIFMGLLSMLRYPKVGFVKDPLAIFTSHSGSITADAESDRVKADAIKNAYDEVRHFYKDLKMLKKLRAIRNFGI